jgi:hypothetical protein
MKKAILTIVLGFGFAMVSRFTADGGAAAPAAAPAYTLPQLLQLIQAKDSNAISADLFATQLVRWNVKLDVATVLTLNSSNVSLADLQEMETALSAQTSGAKVSPVTNLSIAIMTNLYNPTNPPAGSNLTAVAGYLTNVAGSITAQGADTNNLATVTNLTNQLNQIGEGLGSYATNIPRKVISLPYEAFFTVGAEFQNPYEINVSGGKGTLTNAGNSTAGFLEFDYINRHVLRSDPTHGYGTNGTNAPLFGGFLVPPWENVPDVQFRMGFLFDNGTSGSNYSASTLAGADYESSLELGFPIWRFNGTTQNHQISIEGSSGVATDQKFESVHPNYFAGLGYQVAFVPSLLGASSNSPGFFATRVGAGWVDVPSLTGSGGVNVDGNGIPVFNNKPFVELGADLDFPITDKIYLTVGAETFIGNHPPNSWDIKVGASIPLDGIATAFKSFASTNY